LILAEGQAEYIVGKRWEAIVRLAKMLVEHRRLTEAQIRGALAR
jgi:hypothetical protein